MATLLEQRATLGNGDVLPIVRFDTPKPRFVNNGYNVFSGQPKTHVPGLGARLRDFGPSLTVCVYGWVRVQYTDGATLLFATSISDDDTFSFT